MHIPASWLLIGKITQMSRRLTISITAEHGCLWSSSVRAPRIFTRRLPGAWLIILLDTSAARTRSTQLTTHPLAGAAGIYWRNVCDSKKTQQTGERIHNEQRFKLFMFPNFLRRLSKRSVRTLNKLLKPRWGVFFFGTHAWTGYIGLVEESSAQCVFVPRVELVIEYQVHRSQWCDTAYIRRRRTAFRRPTKWLDIYFVCTTKICIYTLCTSFYKANRLFVVVCSLVY